jgi:hypothetical protein
MNGYGRRFGKPTPESKWKTNRIASRDVGRNSNFTLQSHFCMGAKVSSVNIVICLS